MYCTTLPFTFALPDTDMILDVRALYEQMSTLLDRRDRRGVRYPLACILTIAVLAKLTGQNRVQAIAAWARLRTDELRAIFALSRTSLPHPTTWSRILGDAVAASEVDAVVSSFLQSARSAEIPARGQLVLAVDGKTLRGTIPTGHTRGVHLLAAYLPNEGVVLAHVAVDCKENEMTAAPTLLRQIDVCGVVVTGDAMFTQRTLSTQIVASGGDYLWMVKDNQAGLRSEIELLFAPELVQAGWSAPAVDFTSASTIDADHGRIEERRLTSSSLLAEYSDWPYLAQVFQLDRTITLPDGKVRHERCYGVTSLPQPLARATRLLEIVRSHWGIENGLHQRRDGTLQEDAMRVRRGEAPHVLASLNNLVIGLSQQAGLHNLAAAQRALAYHLDKACIRYATQLSS